MRNDNTSLLSCGCRVREVGNILTDPSVLDSIRYALTNRSDRDYIVHRGADEGEIIIETNTGLSIDRKALPAKSAGTVKVFTYS